MPLDPQPSTTLSSPALSTTLRTLSGITPFTHATPEVFEEEDIDVGDGHRMHVVYAGMPDGLPVLVLHGGPGSGQSPALWQGLDGRRFHVIAPDQRGAGRSAPAGGTNSNTLDHLLKDLRRLHRHLGQPRWLVIGGSWGATLAIAHASDVPDAVAGLLLRSSFLGRPEDIAEFFSPWQTGPMPSAQVLTAWQSLTAAASCQHPSDLPRALDGVFQQGSELEQLALAMAWLRWEALRSGQEDPPVASPELRQAMCQRYRVQAHYLARHCDLSAPATPLLQRASRIPPIPTLLLHGAEDRICPPAGAKALQQALACSGRRPALWVAPGAGHGPSHPGMAARWRVALDCWAEHQTWPEREPIVQDAGP